MRLFFALWPDPVVRASLGKLIAGADLGGARPIARENLHATLLFLGQVSRSAIPRIEAAAQTVGGDPFELVFDRVGFWPRPQVAWLGATVIPETLASLSEGLRAAMTAIGAAFDPKPFACHVTLARRARRAPTLHVPSPVVWPVRGYSLVRSESGPAGPSYIPIGEWLLG